jgi:hypothetical protein
MFFSTSVLLSASVTCCLWQSGRVYDYYYVCVQGEVVNKFIQRLDAGWPAVDGETSWGTAYFVSCTTEERGVLSEYVAKAPGEKNRRGGTVWCCYCYQIVVCEVTMPALVALA